MFENMASTVDALKEITTKQQEHNFYESDDSQVVLQRTL
jgi:hypothetical protein